MEHSAATFRKLSAVDVTAWLRGRKLNSAYLDDFDGSALLGSTKEALNRAYPDSIAKSDRLEGLLNTIKATRGG